ncbi:MAG: thioredoxin fold domain-containing protein [Geminicoccaceae bacterium]
MSTIWRWTALVLATWISLVGPSAAQAGKTSDPWHDLAPFVFGEGEQEVVIFTAPSCPFCRQLVDFMPTLAERYRVVVLPISFISYDAQRIRAMACAQDKSAAARAYLLHQDVVLPQQDPCDLSAVEARFAEAKKRRVSAVPFIIRPDGRSSAGLRPDLMAWLAQGETP